MSIRIDLPATLTADYRQYDKDWNKIEGPGRVVVKFGNEEIVSLPAVRKAVNYYDSELNQTNEDEIAQETVAKWLKEKLV